MNPRDDWPVLDKPQRALAFVILAGVAVLAWYVTARAAGWI